MAYIGKAPINGFHSKQSLTGDGSTTSFALDFTVADPSSLIVSVGGVLQEPGVAYTLSGGGANIVFTGAPSSTDTVYVHFLGTAIVQNVLDLNGAEFILDANGNTTLTADTDDEIDIKVGGTDRSTIKATGYHNVDSVKFVAGTGDDMQMYHDGTNSYLTNSQGALKIATETSGIALTIGHTTSEVTFGDNVTVTGNLTIGGTTSFGDFDITNVGSLALDTITNDGTDITLDSSGDIILDAGGNTVFLKDSGTTFGSLDNSSGELVIKSGSTPTTALTFAGANATLAGTLGVGAVTSTGIVTGTGFTAGNAVLAEAELELLDGLTAGTAIASKVVTTDANIDTTGQRNLTITGELDAATLDISGNADIDGTLETDALSINGTTVTSTAAEINLIDGGTARGTTSVASGDGLLVNDGGTMRMTNVDTVSTYFSSHNVGGGNIVTTGALNSGSITSGFGTIDTGSSTITTTGDITGGTFAATGDTAAGDNASIGYTSGEGLILTGQGSTNDITIKNDADAAVISIPTGTTNVTVAGTLTATSFSGSGANLTGLPGGSFTATADGALTTGCATIIQSNGTVAKVAQSVVTQAIPNGAVQYPAGNNNISIIGTSLDKYTSGKGVIVYQEADGSTDDVKCKVFTTSGTTITFGSEQDLYSIANGRRGDYRNAHYCGSDKFVTGGIKSGDTQNSSTNGYVRVHTVSGTTVTTGNESVFNSSYTGGAELQTDKTIDDRVVAHYITSGPYREATICGAISGTSVSWGSQETWTGNNSNPFSTAYDNRVLMVMFKDHTGNYNGKLGAATIGSNGTTQTAGSLVTYDSSTHAASQGSVVLNPNNSAEFCIAYEDKNNSSYGTARFGTLSGNTITLGSAVVFVSDNINGPKIAWDKNYEDKFMIQYRDEGDDAATGQQKFVKGTNASGTISFGSEITIAGSNSSDQSGPHFDQHADGGNEFIHFYQEADNDDVCRWSTMGGKTTTNISSTNFIGFSDAGYSDTNTATILVGGAVATGQSSLTPASAYYVGNDGSLGTSAGSPSVLAGTALTSTTLLITDTTTA